MCPLLKNFSQQQQSGWEMSGGAYYKVQAAVVILLLLYWNVVALLILFCGFIAILGFHLFAAVSFSRKVRAESPTLKINKSVIAAA